ncbi:MAG: CotH kinase family protein [Bacteroidota bacterium]
MKFRWFPKYYLSIFVFFILVNIPFINFSQIYINEFMASNIYIYEDSYTASYPDWIELYNSGTATEDISGFYLSDNPANPFKWIIPPSTFILPGDYLIVWADNLDTLLHTNFSLDALGEFISIYSAGGILVDSSYFPRQYSNISCGRFPDGGPDFFSFDQPTPDLSNNSCIPFYGRTIPPQFIVQPGFYTGSVSVEIAPNGNGDSIFYSLDNTLPDQNSTLYSGPIMITSTIAIHAVSVRNGYINSQMLSGIYLIDIQHDLPVWAILTDSLNLWGPTGIYSNPWSEGTEWEREVQNNYFINQQLEFDDYAGLRIQGGNSVGMDKKSFREFYKGGYGSSNLNYSLFTYTTVNKFKNIVYRAGYDDQISVFQGSLIRDPLVGEFYRHSGGLSSLSEWAVLYLNNRYWGIYNVRESINDYFIQDHTNYVFFDLVRYTKTGPELKYGDLTDWQYLTNFFNTQDFTLDQTYYNACDFIDMDNFINLLAIVHCTQFRSWTWGSFAYKEKSVSGKWRWTLWDADQALKTTSWNGFTEYQYLSAEKWSNFMPNKLITNSIFKRKLINRTADLLNTLFLPDSANYYVDSTAAIIDSEIDNETARWSSNYAYWASNVNIIRTFFITRPNDVRNQILSYFVLPAKQVVALNVVGNGYLHLNTIDIKTFPWQGIYFENNPVDLEAIPYPGYVFYGWDDISVPDTSFFTLNLTDTLFLTAYFVEDTTYVNPLIINEINYNSLITFDPKDWIEIYNPNPMQINLNGWRIMDDNNLNIFEFQQNDVIDSAGFLIVCKDTSAFRSLYPGVAPYTGNISFGFGIPTDMVRLYDYGNNLVDLVSYYSFSPWPEEANGWGPTLELLYPYLDNSIPQSWVANQGYLGTPGEQNRVLSNNIIQFENQFDVSVFPNPFQTEARIKVRTDELITGLEIFSPDGRNFATNLNLVSTENNQFVFLWDGEDHSGKILKSGIYFLKVKTKNSAKIIKLIKL